MAIFGRIQAHSRTEPKSPRATTPMPRCECRLPVLLLNVALAAVSRADGASCTAWTARAAARPATPLSLIQRRSVLEQQAAAAASLQHVTIGISQKSVPAAPGAAALQSNGTRPSAWAPAGSLASPTTAGHATVAGDEAANSAQPATARYPLGVPAVVAWLQMRLSQGSGLDSSDLTLVFVMIVLVILMFIFCMMFRRWKLEEDMEEDRRHLHHVATAGRRGVHAGAMMVERRTRANERQQEFGEDPRNYHDRSSVRRDAASKACC